MEKSGTNPPPYPVYPNLEPQHDQPPPMMMVPPQPAVYGAPTIIVANPVGPQPMPYTCRSCNEQIVTKVIRKSVTKTHLFALLLCLIGCWPCVCIPYCVDSCKSTDHHCPNCDAYIGSYKE